MLIKYLLIGVGFAPTIIIIWFCLAYEFRGEKVLIPYNYNGICIIFYDVDNKIGDDAYQWDKAFIYEEQGQIAPPIYQKYSTQHPIAIEVMNTIVHQENTGAWSPSQTLANIIGIISNIPAFDLSVSCTDNQYRIDFPLMMLYPQRHSPLHTVLKIRGKKDFFNISFLPISFCK